MHLGVCIPDPSKSSVDLKHHESSTSNVSPHDKPYLAPGTSFLDGSPPSTLCIHCGSKGHRMASCSETQSSWPERPLIVSWNNNHLESFDGSHICLHYNVRNTCSMLPSDHHGAHYCSLCGNTCHGVSMCTRN